MYKKFNGQEDNYQKFSIVICIFNSEKFIRRAIYSLQQNAKFIKEVILVDNLSSDNSLLISKNLLKSMKINYSFISEDDFGVYDALNKGFKLAIGKYIGILHSDDFYLPNTLLLAFNKLKSIDSGFVYGNSFYLSKNNYRTSIKSKKRITYKPYLFMPIIHSSIFMTSDISKLHFFDTKYKIAADYKWLLGLLSTKTPMLFIDLEIINLNYTGISNKLIPLSLSEIVKINREEFGLIRTLPSIFVHYIYLKYKKLSLLKGIE